MLASFSQAAIGAIMLVLFGIFYWLGVFATARAVLAFLGTILLGSAGFVGNGLDTVATWLAHLGASASSWLFHMPSLGGVVVTLVTGVVFVHDLLPKKTAGKRTGWAGILLGAILVTGTSGIPALNGVANSVRSGVSNAQQIGG